MFTDWDDETTADSQEDFYADEPWDEEQTVEQFFHSEQFTAFQREIDRRCAACTQDVDPFEPWA